MIGHALDKAHSHSLWWITCTGSTVTPVYAVSCTGAWRPLRPPKPRHHRTQRSVTPDTSSRTARGSPGKWAIRRPKAQLRYVMWQMRPILQNAADVVWGRLIPQRVSNEGWTRTNYMIHHITGLHPPHQAHHSYILKLKPEKSGMKCNYFHPVWLSWCN